LITFDLAAGMAEQPSTRGPVRSQPLRFVNPRVRGSIIAADVGVKRTGHVARTPGNLSRAQQLSEQRAEAIAEALIAQGVAANRIQTEGASDTAPKADLASSRRVEIQLI
jgi:hypothetical protein